MIRSVGGRRQIVDDIDLEADAPVNLPQENLNLPVDSDLDGGPGTKSKSD
jgi:hypothetical protein